MTIDYSRFDAAYTKYVKNRAGKYQDKVITETLNEIFPNIPPVTMMPVRETADSKYSFGDPKPKQTKKSSVMVTTGKRAITLEDL